MRITLLLLAGAVIGTIVGMVVSYAMPKIYQVRARVEGSVHASHDAQITRYRAELLVTKLGLEGRWRTTRDKATEEVQKTTHLEPDQGGVTITARYTNPLDALTMAREVAVILDTPAREKESAGMKPPPKRAEFRPKSEEEQSKLWDIQDLESLLEHQAVKAGFEGTWGQIFHALDQDPILVELAKDEDFSRRLAKLRELSAELHYEDPPDEPRRSAHWNTLIEPLPDRPVSPDVSAILNGFRLLGMALAGLLIPVLLRWKPEKLRPEPQAPRPPAPRKRSTVENDDPW
ncbi:hypothetical protein [Haloferula sp. BvORR071]|uniref:hypothetical protein n=1 Tax=Haloferula sp. BvORR071 TaxID=1396141 RepID=UPI00054FF24F|nr:hypothetical protein [Haloferula sp. BvORR071]